MEWLLRTVIHFTNERAMRQYMIFTQIILWLANLIWALFESARDEGIGISRSYWVSIDIFLLKSERSLRSASGSAMLVYFEL